MTERRIVIAYDKYGQQNQDGSDGHPLPESPEAYAESPYMKDGEEVPYEEYLDYYGDPDKHTILEAYVEERCPCCGTWKPADGDASLSGIDFMEDEADAGRVGTYTPAEIEAWPADSYLRDVCLDLLKGTAKYAIG